MFFVIYCTFMGALTVMLLFMYTGCGRTAVPVGIVFTTVPLMAMLVGVGKNSPVGTGLANGFVECVAKGLGGSLPVGTGLMTSGCSSTLPEGQVGQGLPLECISIWPIG